MKMSAWVTEELNNFTWEEDIELDAPKADEVLVEIVACGVCHTDTTVLDGTVPSAFPKILGHEGSGIVKEVGANVRGIQPGDHVVLAWSVCCECEECMNAHPSNCELSGMLNFGGVMIDGTTPIHNGKGQDVGNFFGQSSFAEYAIVNQKNCVVIDKDVPLEIMGPLGCGVNTGAGTVLVGLKPEPGDTIAVFGTGGVGMSAMMGAKIANCSKIIAVDIVDSRLKMAKKIGATDVVNSKGLTPDEVAAKIHEITGGKGVNWTVDTTGVPDVFIAAIRSLCIGGTLGYVAVPRGPVEINPADLLFFARKINAIMEGDTVTKYFIPKLVDYYKRGQLPFDKLIKKYPVTDIEKAFADSASGKVIKPVLIFKEDYE